MWVIALVSAALLCQTPVPGARGGRKSPGSGSVRGIVVRADTGAPISRAALRLIGPGAGTWEAASDASGRFEFTALPAGRYLLTATRAGYVTGGAEQRRPSEPSPAFELAAGQAADGFVIRMLRGGAVTGRIVDGDGEPVVEAHVRALRAEYMSGVRRLNSRSAAQTNDLGEYRLYGLLPGTYYITAAQRSVDLATYDPQNPPVVTRGAIGFAPTFFPGTVFAADAQPVTVRAGADVPAIDFALGSVRLARLSGVIVDSRGRPAPGNLVMLHVARTGGASVTSGMLDMNVVEPSADGSFVLSNVKPGEYRLDVYAKSAVEAIARSGSVGLSQGADMTEYASVPITVSGEDIENLRIATMAGSRLTGRVVVEGAASGPDVLSRLKISTVDASAGLSASALMLGAGGPVGPDGSFEVHGVSGTRLVRVNGLAKGWALKAVRASGIDVTDEGIEVRGADIADLDVVVTAKPAQISGLVVDDRGRPAPGAAVVIFPNDRSRWTAPLNRYVASATAGADGSFSVSPLPAADYLVAVVDELVDGEWAEADYLERLRATATRVTLGDGESKAITLRR